MSVELIPCPFCGSDNVAQVKAKGYGVCFICGAQGPQADHDGRAWNKRAIMPGTVKIVRVGQLPPGPPPIEDDDGTFSWPEHRTGEVEYLR